MKNNKNNNFFENTIVTENKFEFKSLEFKI